jgi:hypothetical protein
MADSLLFRLGYISQNEAACTGSSTSFNTSASFANFPNMPTATFVVPLGGLYMAHLDMAGFWQATGTFGIAFQVVNTTIAATGTNTTWNWYPSAINQRVPRFSARIPLRMQVGANTIQVQAKMLNAGETLGQDTSTVRAITVTA